MSESERARFVQRRRNDLYAVATNLFIIGPLIFSIPALLVALVIAGCVWALSLVIGDPAWSYLVPALATAGGFAVLVYVAIYAKVVSSGVDRCKLPRDAVLRVLDIDSEQLRKMVIGYAPRNQRYWSPAPVVQLEIPGVGSAILPIIDPEEGELRVSDLGALRIGWSPLRKYFVEWVEVPSSWPAELVPVNYDETRMHTSLSNVSDLNNLYDRMEYKKKPPADAGGS
jgi:hypothetical protein